MEEAERNAQSRVWKDVIELFLHGAPCHFSEFSGSGFAINMGYMRHIVSIVRGRYLIAIASI